MIINQFIENLIIHILFKMNLIILMDFIKHYKLLDNILIYKIIFFNMIKHFINHLI